MRPDQFALSPFNRITVLEARLELTSRLLFMILQISSRMCGPSLWGLFMNF
jgi:hypothetical protein